LGELECAVGTVPHIGATSAEHTGWSVDGDAMRKRSPPVTLAVDKKCPHACAGEQTQCRIGLTVLV